VDLASHLIIGHHNLIQLVLLEYQLIDQELFFVGKDRELTLEVVLAVLKIVQLIHQLLYILLFLSD
jgi:hypothetical protein